MEEENKNNKISQNDQETSSGNLDEERISGASSQVIEENTPPHTPSSKELNFKALRESKERVERERDEAIRQYRELLAKQSSVKSSEREDDFDLSEYDIVEGRHIKQLKKEIEDYKKQTYAMAAEAQLKAKYPDFDTVVTQENIKKLETLYPEVAATLATSPDLYKTGASAYTMIKKLGIMQDSKILQEKEIIKENLKKPSSTYSVSPQQGSDALSQADRFANGLTEDLKKQLYKEMLECASR